MRTCYVLVWAEMTYNTGLLLEHSQFFLLLIPLCICLHVLAGTTSLHMFTCVNDEMYWFKTDIFGDSDKQLCGGWLGKEEIFRVTDCCVKFSATSGARVPLTAYL